MSREILFRGKCLKKNDWHEGDLIQGNSVNCYENTAGKSFIVGWYLGSIEMIEVDPKTVGQFIGLRDKNGKRIFEGDVLKVLTSSNFFVEVYFHENAMFTCREITKGAPCSQIYAKESEVVGNIYENPELLETK